MEDEPGEGLHKKEPGERGEGTVDFRGNGGCVRSSREEPLRLVQEAVAPKEGPALASLFLL